MNILQIPPPKVDKDKIVQIYILYKPVQSKNETLLHLPLRMCVVGTLSTLTMVVHRGSYNARVYSFVCIVITIIINICIIIVIVCGIHSN